MGKITRPQIWIILSILGVVVALALFFIVSKPVMDSTDVEQKRYDARNPIAQDEPNAIKDKEKAKQEVAQATASWELWERKLMPKINVSDLYMAWQQLQNEQLRYLGPQLEKFVRADKSVRIEQANFTLPPVPDDPNQANSPIFVFSPGSVTVSGTFENILKHVERWNSFNRLVLVTGFQLQGNSPRLYGSYNLQVFEFTQGNDKPGIGYPAAAGGGGGGGRMGGPGGMPGGMMGSSGMMMGGGGMRGAGGPTPAGAPGGSTNL